MYIEAGNFNQSRVVNQLGKYLWKNLDGAYEFQKSSNTYDVYTVILYQIPVEIIEEYNLDGKYKDVNEMKIDINITTYGDKIRINFIEVDPDEQTLGQKIFDLSKGNDLKFLRDELMRYLYMRLNKLFKNYEFLY